MRGKGILYRRWLNGLGALLVLLLSLPSGRLFEIFSWNSSIVRIESIVLKSNSSNSQSYQYTQLNEKYWEEKSIEEAKISLNFSPRYIILNKEIENRISFQNNQFDNHKLDLIHRVCFKNSYVDEEVS